MARVRMLKSACGPMGSFQAGKHYDMDDDLALAFMEGAAAVLLDAPPTKAEPVVETAVVTPTETAVAPAQQSRRRR